MNNSNYLFNLSSQNNVKTMSKSASNTLTLYYCIYKPDGVTLNGTETIFETNPEDLETYRGISNRYMSDVNSNLNTDILTYVGSRTKAKNPDFPKSMYNEVLTITSEPYSDNIVHAACNYEDTGSSLETLVPFNNFVILGASGKFAGYTNIKITYNNNNTQKTRTMLFS